jgi:DNA adenine methylase
MNCLKEKIISPLKQHGGKAYIAKKIISKMEFRDIFVEGFCATSITSLYLSRAYFTQMFCFDSNPFIINFWNVLQSEPDRLIKFLRNTEYGEANFERAKEHLRSHEDEPGEPFFDAAMFFIVNRMSRSADGKTFGWSDRLRRGMPEYISAYGSAVENLGDISRLIKYINFRHGKYIDLMVEYELHKNPNVLQYLDPPYLPETRISKNSYGRHDMTEDEHKDLLDFVTRDCQGLTYLSGYNSSLYTSALADYESFSWSVSNNSSQQKIKPVKTEMLWKI